MFTLRCVSNQRRLIQFNPVDTSHHITIIIHLHLFITSCILAICNTYAYLTPASPSQQRPTQPGTIFGFKSFVELQRERLERERQAQEATTIKNNSTSIDTSINPQRPPDTGGHPSPQMHGNRLGVDTKGPGRESTSPTIPTSKPPGSASGTSTPLPGVVSGGPGSRVVPTIPAGNNGLRPSYTQGGAGGAPSSQSAQPNRGKFRSP